MPTVEIDGQPLFYARHASPAGQAANVILLHGAGGNRLVWPAQLRRLPDATVYVLDLPGHGRSPAPGRDRIEDYTGVVAAFIARLSIAPAVVVGHSMGGAIAQSLAQEYAALLQGIVLLATGAQLRVNRAILGQINSDFQAATTFILDHYWGPDAPPQLIESGRRLLLESDPETLYGDFAACDAFDMTERLATIEVPALVISGTADQMMPAKYGRHLAESLHRARLVLVEDGGHMLMLEKAPLVAAAVQQFLEELSNTPAA